jgi:hypothetical protein
MGYLVAGHAKAAGGERGGLAIQSQFLSVPDVYPISVTLSR